MNQFILAANESALTTVWNFFWNGGIFMMLLLATSLSSFTLILWRIIALKRELVIPKDVEAAVASFTPTETNLSNLLELLRRQDSPFSRIVMQACRQFNWTKSENLTALQTLARKEIHQLERGLTQLEIITGLGPLLGLLGTVSGLVAVFSSLGTDGTNTAGVASGIAEALNTTIMGLAVAIPSMIAFSIFSKRVEWLAVDMEANIESLLAKCYHEPYVEDAHHQAPAEEPAATVAEEADASTEKGEEAKPAAKAKDSKDGTRTSIQAKPAGKKGAQQPA